MAPLPTALNFKIIIIRKTPRYSQGKWCRASTVSARMVWGLQESHGQGAHPKTSEPKSSEEHLQSSLQKGDVDIKIQLKREIYCSFVSYSGGQTERVALKSLFFPKLVSPLLRSAQNKSRVGTDQSLVQLHDEFNILLSASLTFSFWQCQNAAGHGV